MFVFSWLKFWTVFVKVKSKEKQKTVFKLAFTGFSIENVQI